MYVQIGTYAHAAAEAGVVFTAEQIRSPRGDPYVLRKRLTVSGLLIPTAGEDNMTTAIEALEAAYVDQPKGTGDCGLYQTDGTATPHMLDNGSSLDGIKVVQRQFPNAEEVYSVNRQFSVTLEADYPLGWPRLLAFSETIQLIGAGGPNKVFVRLVQGVPDYQETSTNTETRATQSGFSVATYPYPSFALPAWPDDEQTSARNISYSSPVKRDGYFTEYTTRWSYQFVGNIPFFQLPGSPNTGS